MQVSQYITVIKSIDVSLKLT